MKSPEQLVMELEAMRVADGTSGPDAVVELLEARAPLLEELMTWDLSKLPDAQRAELRERVQCTLDRDRALLESMREEMGRIHDALQRIKNGKKGVRGYLSAPGYKQAGTKTRIA